jgi:malate dehydrogenase (quinone)
MNDNNIYDVAIIGGGASGTALLYVLAKYTNIKNIVLLEKYDELGIVNSNPVNNSQTLHVGDIETNYPLEKARQVMPAAMMVKRYTDSLPDEERKRIISNTQKMVLAIGKDEVEELEKRFLEIRELYPTLKKIGRKEIEELEPEIIRGRSLEESVLALYNPEGYAVNFGNLAKSLGEKARHVKEKRVDILLGQKVEKIEKEGDGYTLHTQKNKVYANVVIVDTDAYSLGLAKSLGYGKEFSLIPIAGSFYFTPQKLRGKVYRVQNKRMPFAAVHGDPDLTKLNVTRWGPTARFYPVLEARKIGTMKDFFSSAGIFRIKTWISFGAILLDPLRFWYLLKNLFYDLPFIGTYFFLGEVKKIIPTLAWSDITRAKNYGGMRLQRVDTNTRSLLLGEGKIVGDNIVFNMSPSPGASVSLYNAMRDADQMLKFNPAFSFAKEDMLKDLCVSHTPIEGTDISLPDTYAS